MLPPSLQSTIPLYRRIAEQIRREFVAGKPEGMRLPPERDLSRSFEVSPVTIRTALKELEKEGLVERRQGSGTYVLEPRTTKQHVALLLEADISSPNLSPFYLRLLQELRMQLTKERIPSRPYLGHLRLGVEIGELTCREFFDELRDDHIEAVISVHALPHTSWTLELKKRNIPLISTVRSRGVAVGIGQLRFYEKATYSTYRKAPLGNGVSVQALRTIICDLVARDHRKLAIIGYNDHDRDRVPNVMAFRRLAEEHGIETEDRWFFDRVNGLEPGAVRRVLQEIRNSGSPLPDVIFLSCDTLLAECVEELEVIDPSHSIALVACATDAVKCPPRPNFYCHFSEVRDVASIMIAMLRKCREQGAAVENSSMEIPVRVHFHPEDGSPQIQLPLHAAPLPVPGHQGA